MLVLSRKPGQWITATDRLTGRAISVEVVRVNPVDLTVTLGFEADQDFVILRQELIGDAVDTSSRRSGIAHTGVE